MSPEKGPFQKEISSSNHQFSREIVIFRGILKFSSKTKILKFKQSSQKHAKLQAPSFCSFYFLHRLSREAPGFFTAMGHRFNFIKSWNGTQGGSTSLYNSWQVIQVVEGALKVELDLQDLWGKFDDANVDSWKGSGCHAVMFFCWKSNGLHQAKVRLVQKGDLDQEVTTIQQVFGV